MNNDPMNIRVLSSAENLISGIVSLLPAECRDFSDYMIVFPGRRPGHFLRKALAEQAGSSILPPAIYSMDECIDTLFEERQQKRKIGPMDAVAVLHDIHTRTSARIGGQNFLSLDSFFPIGMKIFRDIEELLIEQVPLNRVKEINDLAAGAVPERSLAMLQSLAYFYERFYQQLDELGFSTRSVRYRAVADGISRAGLSKFKRIIFAGFFALTRSEHQIFKGLLDRPDVYFLFQQGRGIEERLHDLGIGEEHIPEDAGPLPEISFYSSPDTHGQIFALNAALQGQALPDEKTSIVLPSSDMLFPLIRQGLSGLEDGDYNISIGYPLERTPLFGFLQNLMDLIGSMEGDRVYLPAYLNFVLHPYTKNIYYQSNAEVTRILFHTIEESFSRTSVRAFITLNEIETNAEVFQKIAERLKGAGLARSADEMRSHLRKIHDQTIKRFLSFSSVADFAAGCTGLLTFIFNNSSAKLHPLFSRFADAFLQTISDMECSLLCNRSFRERDGYFALLRRCLGSGSVPFEGAPVRGLQVLGMLETRSLKFDRIFVLHANEEVLPSVKKEDSLLPFKARRLLGLPTYIEREQLAAYNFDILIKGSKEAHLFFIESDSKERSRFVERLLWQKQQKEKKKSDRDYIRPVQYLVKLNNQLPEEIGKTAEIVQTLKTFRYSPSALDTYFRCPLKFYYQYLLRIGKRDEMTGEIARTDIGNVVHAILRRFFDTKRGRPLAATDMDPAEIRAMTHSYFQAQYGSDLVGAHYLLEQQVADQLAAFIEAYYLPLVRENEIEVLATEYKEEITVEGCRLEGRMDILEKRNGKVLIIDYKTGSAVSYLKINHKKLVPDDPETWRSSIGSLQLPCYVMIYAGKNNIDLRSMNAAYLMLGRSVMSREIEVPLFEAHNAGEVYDNLSSIIRSLLREIIDPEVPFVPAHDIKRSCPDCDFRFICGTQWIVKKR
ncbi:MAG: PD-(D/E)XK nuclease family protein [Nitrospirae bacterium]|nr:PD-(D/E)XK nuclease family protein [Nitrospirota bacterium]